MNNNEFNSQSWLRGWPEFPMAVQILCQPCNSKRLNTMTLDALRKENKREKLIKKDESQLIDLIFALTWTRNCLLKIREQTPKQYDLFRNKM